MSIAHEYERALNRLAKWRSVFTGRWLGTRSIQDPEAIAVRDVFEKLLILRVELTAISNLLIDQKIYSINQYMAQVTIECGHLQAALERQFPGHKACDYGMDIDIAIAAETTKGWPK